MWDGEEKHVEKKKEKSITRTRREKGEEKLIMAGQGGWPCLAKQQSTSRQILLVNCCGKQHEAFKEIRDSRGAQNNRVYMIFLGIYIF